jgi:hypothetical protein
MNQNTVKINEVLFQTGDLITCNIMDTIITDVKIYIDYAHGMGMDCYLCQNEFNGNRSPDLLGYKYSYEVFIHINDKCNKYCIEKYHNNIFNKIIEKSFPKRLL